MSRPALDICIAAARHFGLSLRELSQENRGLVWSHADDARQLALCLIRQRTMTTREEIGALFDMHPRLHNIVINEALRDVTERLGRDPLLRAALVEIEAALNSDLDAAGVDLAPEQKEVAYAD